MIKLRTILLQSNIYRVTIVGVIIYALIVTLLPKYESVYKGSEEDFLCSIDNYKIEEDKMKLELVCKEKLVGSYYFKNDEYKFFKKKVNIGSSVIVKGKLVSPKNNTVPYLFNYKKYLYNKRVYYTLKIDSIKILNENSNPFIKLKNRVIKHVNSYKDSTYLYAFILGKTELISDEVLTSYRENGISHLFALSGLHVSIFSSILLFILKKLRFKEILNYVLIFIFLLLFSFITGFSPSILRATLLFFLLSINKVFYLNIRTLDILYLVFIILVIINPFIIYNLNFILSFTAAFFLIFSSDLLKGKNYFVSLFKVSLLSYFASLPLSIYYFGYTNLLGTILNLVFVPLVSFVVFPLTLLTFIISKFYSILNITTNLLESLSLLFNKFKIIIYFPRINLIFVFIYLSILMLYIKFKKKICLYLIIVLLIFFKIRPYMDNNTYIYYIDVGQGDSILVVTPHLNKTILIDTGGIVSFNENYKSNIVKNKTIPFFRRIGINKVDYLFLTHGDYDHAGEANELLSNFCVKKVFINKGNINNIEKKINNKEVLRLKNFVIDNIKVNSLNNNVFNNENDDSTILLFNIYDYKFLFMGDASIKTEEYLLNNYILPNVDILKVGHHGSYTSTSTDFINVIKPKYSVISVGENNMYKHPNKSVLDILDNTKLFRTDVDGTIEVKISKKGYKIKTYVP
ncbi:dNA internalization-related competence protein ComEC/Rec2 [Clostridium sp. CAG:628]|nr:dNA internalization-related competence protein ComEC/Rec2 [Clostridium sp. CAG:628]